MKIFEDKDLCGKDVWYFSKEGTTPEDEGIAPICETDRKVDIGDVVIINAQAYSVYTLSGKVGTGFVRAYVRKILNQDAVMGLDEPESIYESECLICPYCGEEMHNTFELSDSNDEYECPCCGSTFAYERDVIITYNVEPVKKCRVKNL